MQVKIGDVVMHPGYQPYPRYGRVIRQLDDDQILVTQVQCGDPRCAAEHHHGDLVWSAADVVAALAYQPRADWEEGRKSSPNALVDD
jgi:hypothetical protein